MRARMPPMFSTVAVTVNVPPPATAAGSTVHAERNSSGRDCVCRPGCAFGSGGFLPSSMVTYTVNVCCAWPPSASR